ncbi:MAG: flagellar hook-associated protein FlgK [Armatimonadota bacterium]
MQTAMSGLMAQQRALEVTSQNVANLNTPGYHRQEAVLVSSPSVQIGGSLLSQAGASVGSGVDVLTIRRVQDQFLQRQLWQALGQTARWAMASDGLQQVEQVLAPGTDIDLSTMLNRFFTAWQGLAAHPEEMSARLTVRAEGENLAHTLNDMATKLADVGTQIDFSIEMRVTQINDLSDRLAALNAEIGQAKAEGRAPNDLMDQREEILGQLTTLAGVTNLSNDEATGITNLGGRALVQGNVAFHIQWDAASRQIVWQSDGSAATIASGEIAGLLEVRDGVIPSYLQQLDDIAAALAGAVNSLHNNTLNPNGAVTLTGAPAGDFFNGNTAGSIAVSAAILADAGEIATTGTPGAVGDGSLATQMFNLHQSALIGTQTLNQTAESLVGLVGTATRTAQTNLQASTALQNQVQVQQQAVSGVSLDEEMANLLVYQRAYDASARVLSIADQMLQTLLERLG